MCGQGKQTYTILPYLHRLNPDSSAPMLREENKKKHARGENISEKSMLCGKGGYDCYKSVSETLTKLMVGGLG